MNVITLGWTGEKMKVVINACYGGFGLSQKAVKKLAMAESSIIEVMPVAEYHGDSDPERFGKFVDVGDGFKVVTHMDDVLYKSDSVYFLKDRSKSELRANAELIAVIEELGKEANGFCAALKIVEIPDGIEWEVAEYDGYEHIDEVHRSWS
jgi:hypothetical protein